MDTVGLMDTETTTEKVAANLVTAGMTMDPGPHVVFFVNRLDVKYTEDEHKVFNDIIRLFGRGILKYLIVLYTRAEHLKGMDLDVFLKEGKLCCKNYHNHYHQKSITK